MDNSLPSIVTFGYGRANDLWPFTLIDGARSYAAVADAGVVRLGRPDAGGPHYLTILFLLGQAIGQIFGLGFEELRIRGEQSGA